MIITDKYHLYNGRTAEMDLLTMSLGVSWRKTIRFNGFIPRVVTVPRIEHNNINIIANGILKVKVKFSLSKDALLEYKLTCGELPKKVKVAYKPLPCNSHWVKLSANWHSIYDTQIIIK